MSLRDLARKHEAYAASLRLRRVERDKHVAWVHKPRAAVFDRQEHIIIVKPLGEQDVVWRCGAVWLGSV